MKFQTPTRQTDLPTLLTEKSPGVLRSSSKEGAPEFDIPNSDTSITESVDDILTAFGDISITNVFFVPGLSSGISPAQSAAHAPKRTAARLRPKSSPFRADRPLPSVIQRVLPTSPSKPRISPEEDFELLVENMRSHQSKSLIRTALSSPSKKCAPSIPPRRGIRIPAKERGGITVNEAVGHPIVRKGLDMRAPTAPLPPAAILAPKPKERPLRGYAKLPRRPPLPRWDLLDPVVYNKALEDPGSLLGNMSQRPVYRT